MTPYSPASYRYLTVGAIDLASTSGAITAIRPQLPKDTQIEGLITSDLSLYARVNSATDGAIYEISAHDGTVMRRLQLSDGRTASEVACVHDGKFLSFEHGEGKLIPLIGTAEPAAPAENQSKGRTFREMKESSLRSGYTEL